MTMLISLKSLIIKVRHFVFQDAVFLRILTNSGWLLGGGGISTGLGFIQSVVVTRALGVKQYGILALVMVYIATVNQFMDSRVWEAAIKYIVHFRENGDLSRATAVMKLCYLIDAVTGGLAFTALFLTATWAASVFIKDTNTVRYIQIYSLSVLLMIPAGTSSAILRINNRFRVISNQLVGIATFKLVMIIIVVFFGWGVLGILCAQLLATGLNTLLLVITSRRSMVDLQLAPWRQSSLRLLRGEIRRILKFIFNINLIGTSRIVSGSADTLILGWLGNPETVGLYKLAKNVIDPLSIVFNSLYNTTYPEMTRLVSQGQFSNARLLQRRLSTSTLLLILPICLTTMVLAPWFIPFAFGQQFVASVILAQILIWQIIWTPLIWFPGWLLSLERVNTLVRLNWLDAGIYIVLLLIFVTWLGTLGAVIATVIRYVVWTLMALGIFVRINHNLTGKSKTEYDAV